MPPKTSVSFDPLPGVVLQCSSCKTIVGDTQEFVCAATLPDAKLIVIRAATDVTVDRIPTTAAPQGRRRTFFHVCCAGCGSALGRMYTDAPPTLAALVNTFAFDVAKCVSYRVGSADLRVSGQGAAAEGGDAEAAAGEGHAPANGAAAPAMHGHGPEVGEMVARMEALESELLKMQGMILLHDTQLQGLSGYPTPPPDG